MAYALHIKHPVPAEDAPTRPDQPPGPPKLLTPAHRATVPSNTPTFTWNAPTDDSAGRLMYAIEFAFDKHFSAGIKREYANIYETTFQVPQNEPFAPGLTIYWRAYAVDTALNQGPYSPIFEFTPLGKP